MAALGLKANVAEAEHPLLCEGTRRQRGDLALSMMVHYKDDQNKLGKVSTGQSVMGNKSGNVNILGFHQFCSYFIGRRKKTCL